MSTASLNRSPTRRGTCASLPNDTARPPDSRHQVISSTDASGVRVLNSITRPLLSSQHELARHRARAALGELGDECQYTAGALADLPDVLRFGNDVAGTTP